MKCPFCFKGTIYVHVPIFYKYRVKDNGEIIETKDISDLMYIEVRDQAFCNTCGSQYLIRDDKVIANSRADALDI